MKIGLVIAWLAWSFPALAFDLQGHRGARGLAPENTLPAFERAIGIGVTTLETDLGLTKDGVVVLAHDPRLNPDLVRDASGAWLTGPQPTIRSLSFAELQSYDIGRLNPAGTYAALWPDQRPVDGTRFPRLIDLIELTARRAPSIRFNIETKLSPLKPDETADVDQLVTAILAVVRAAKIEGRVTIQSFDWRTLLASRRLAPDIATSCLTIETANTNTLRPVDGAVTPWLGGLDPAAHGQDAGRLAKAAGCAVWSPFWRNVDAAKVKSAQALGLKVVPWTVNGSADMTTLIDMGVDGLITDYPDRARGILDDKSIVMAR